MSKGTKTIYKSSVTGRFVKASTVKSRPKTTYTAVVKKGKCK